MKRLTVFLSLIFLGLGFGTAFSQMKPQIPAKTYYCAKVEDILINPKDFSTADKISVGVRLRFTKQSYIPGPPAQRLCNCAFEGPSGELAKAWTKTISLRLIGLKYSEKETDVLEYYGPTPSFFPYTYSGFQVIGVTITEWDLKEGVKDFWGWAPKKNPLKDSREFKIYATLDVNGYALKRNDDLDYLKKGCFPSEDFVKSFKPKQLEVPKLKEDIIKKGIEKGAQSPKEAPAETPKVTYFQKETLRIPPQKFLLEKLPPIKFIPFDRSYFNIRPTQNTVTLKNRKTLTVDKFLAEVNELEQKLNELGYTLKDNKPIKIKYIYPRDQFKLQKEMFSKDFLKKITIPLPPQVTCEDYSTGGEASSTGGPKDFVPLDWERKWDVSFGNDDFGVNLIANMTIEGRENYLNVNPFFDAGIAIFENKVDVLRIEKSGNNVIGKLIGNQILNMPLSTELKNKTLDDAFEWSTSLSFPIGPIDVSGTFGFRGRARIMFNGKIDPSSGKVNGNLSPYLSAEAFGELGAGYEIVTVGIGGKLLLISDNANLMGSLELVKSSNRYFKFSAIGENKVTLLSGKLYAYAEIDYLIGSKQIEVDLYDFDGFNFAQPLFSINNISVPAEKDHKVWLKINNISGITPYTARNEKLEIEPREFDVIVKIGERSYFKTVKDYNKDGLYGKALGEYEPLRYEIPLLSFKKVPISIEVIERYKIGTLDFKNTLDFAPGIWRKVELCYDPKTRTFSGTKSGKEDERIRSVGDSNYWGERYHQIIFELTAEGGFKEAPAKAK
jgi:hypothetical protein